MTHEGETMSEEPTMTATQRRILSDAIKTVQAGWTPHTSDEHIDGVECACACEAIAYASAGLPWVVEEGVRNHVRAAVNARGFDSIATFNNAPGRTKDEVVALLQSVLDADRSV